jgi:transposase-like protein
VWFSSNDTTHSKEDPQRVPGAELRPAEVADDFRMALEELLRKSGSEDADFLRDGVRLLAQELMELEVRQHLGAERYERTEERRGHRNGSRERQWDTRVGTIELSVPRVRDNSYFPSLLQPRKRAEQALVAVVQEAYVHGVSTRRVDDLVQALGMSGISKSQVSRLCQTLDAEVERFRNRWLEGPYPYVWLDATFPKVRQDDRVVSMALVIAIGVNARGEREVLGLDVGASENGAFWLAFLRSLVARGLTGVRLVTSDAHEGLKAAIAAVLQGPAGNAVGCMGCGMPWRWSPRRHSRWWERRSGRCSASRMWRGPESSGSGWQRASGDALTGWQS